MLASATKRVIASTSTQTSSAARQGSVSSGHMATIPPNPVATPLPPLKPSQGEYMWPSSAAIATANQSHTSPGGIASPPWPPSRRPHTPESTPLTMTGTAPLAASRKKQMNPYRRPSSRPTFVAPMLPDPRERTSIPLARPIR